MRTCVLLFGALAAFLLVSCTNAAAGGPCDADCNTKLDCCSDQILGKTCYNISINDCTANKQICAKGLFLCDKTCYDGTLYDCITPKLCPKGLQLCGSDQCYDTARYACVANTQILRKIDAAECGGVGYNTNINECVNGTLGPIRPSTPCAPHQALCGTYCYDPELYSCGQSGNLTSLPGFCGQGEVWCGIKCYNPLKYTCQNGALVNWAAGDACPSGQMTCGQVCYNPSANLVCTDQLIICPTGMGVCNNTCFNNTRYDCMNNEIVMHDGYCPTNMGLCGTRCYNMSNYNCERDLLVPVGVVGCGNSPCLSQDSCCSDDYNGTLCFENTYYQCAKNNLGSKLCGKGLSLCGDECFDSSIYSCVGNNVLCPTGLDYCTSNNFTGCYDKSTFNCLASSTLCPIGGTQCGGACINIDKYTCKAAVIEFVLCVRGQLNCGGTCFVPGGKLQCINRTLVEVDDPGCPDGTCNTTCYETSRAYCIDGKVVNIPDCEGDEEVCYIYCYNSTGYVCENNAVYVKCDPGMDRCNQTCYDEDLYDCVNNQVVAEKCSSKGLGDCGNLCYNTTWQTCKDGGVYNKCADNFMDCGRSCYNPDTQDCSSGTIIPKCNNGTKLCAQKCFDPATQECSDNTIIPICLGSTKRCGQLCYDPSAKHCDDGTILDNSASLATMSFSVLIILIICVIF